MLPQDLGVSSQLDRHSYLRSPLTLLSITYTWYHCSNQCYEGPCRDIRGLLGRPVTILMLLWPHIVIFHSASIHWFFMRCLILQSLSTLGYNCQWILQNNPKTGLRRHWLHSS